MSVMQGGSFEQAFWSGALGSLGASGWNKMFGTNGASMIAFGALSGGIGAELSGGNFWEGAVIGGVVAGLNHAMHKENNGKPRKPKGSKRVISKDQTHSLSKGSRGGQSVITPENPGNQVGNGRGMFIPSGSQSMVTTDMTYYDDGTVDIKMTTQAARMNTTGSYVANYEIIGPNGHRIDGGILLNKSYGISRMDYPVYTQKGSAAVLSTATLRNIPINSTIRINVGLTYQIPAGSTGVIGTNHIIRVR